jgi:sugar lactone lactonase YvrE
VADEDNDRVRRVDGAGTIATVVGTGKHGFAGDGGVATRAKLSSPHSLAVGVDGSLFITDRWNGRVRRMDPFGIITTVAIVEDPGGLAIDLDRRLYVADELHHRVLLVWL